MKGFFFVGTNTIIITVERSDRQRKSFTLFCILFLINFSSLAFCETEQVEIPHGKNVISLEYLPIFTAFALNGGGLGLGYEREIADWFSIHSLAAFGYIPAGNSGELLIFGASLSVLFSPFSRMKGFKVGLRGGLLYLSAQGEELYGGLEAHYIFPYLGTSVGWRFLFGKKNVRIMIQPELCFSIIFPGPTGSGTAGNLQWYSSGLYIGIFYPNVTFGVSF